jgi:hypothetical protein
LPHSPDPIAAILPAPEPYRTIVGGHARQRYSQPLLPDTKAICRGHLALFPPNNSQKLAGFP